MKWRWNDEEVAFIIVDDGPGFPPEIVSRIGEPYMSTRQGGRSAAAGLASACSSPRRCWSARARRSPSAIPTRRARARLVEIVWPRAAFLRADADMRRAMFDTA